jgi:hypothetical protein
MNQCKRLHGGEYATYLYRGYTITRIPPEDGGIHWNIAQGDSDPFDARQTKADAKAAIDNWENK